MIIRIFKNEDIFQVAELVKTTFEKFNGLDFYDIKGIQTTLDCFDKTKKLKKNF